MPKKVKPDQSKSMVVPEPVTIITTVHLVDLAQEFGVPERVIRKALRDAGLRAPAVANAQGFGPRSKYEWLSNSFELQEVRKLLQARFGS